MPRFRLPRAGLWTNRDFLWFWSAETFAQFGFQISAVCVPLIAAVIIHASPFEMGLLGAASQAPRVLFGFVAGAWADRHRRRPIMIAMDLTRVITSSLIPVASLIDQLSFGILLTSALLAGSMAVVFDAAWSAHIADLVAAGQLSDAMSKLAGSASLAQVLGPALGGSLLVWMGGANVMWITALGYGMSAWFLMRIHKPEEQLSGDGESPSTMWHDVREGLRELWRVDVVRDLLVSTVVLNTGGYIFLSVYVLFMTNDLRLDERGVGLVYASGGIGALIGSVLAPRLADRVGVGRTILLGSIGFGISNFLVPVSFFAKDIALALVIAAELMAWMFLKVFNINRFALRQALTPARLRGRVGSSQMTIVATAVLIGNLVGGTIGDLWTVHTALWTGVALMFAACWWVWRSRVLEYQTMPEIADEI